MNHSSNGLELEYDAPIQEEAEAAAAAAAAAAETEAAVETEASHPQPTPPSPLPPQPASLAMEALVEVEAINSYNGIDVEETGEPAQPTEPALEDGPPRVEFSAPDCPVESVIVYLDKAEVRRLLRFRSRAGETEVLLRDLTPAIDGDSVRVELAGAASISDVAFSAAPSQPEEARRATEKVEATAELDRERRAATNAASRLDRALKQSEVLASYADALAKQPMPVECNGPYDPRRVATLNGFFELYEAQAARLDEEVAEAREALTRHREAVGKLEARLCDIEVEFGELMHREVRVYVESRQAADIELQLSYIVSRAKWTPRYDIRVHSNESILQIVYHGMVQQQTGEAWSGTRISLSTSRPGVGGSAPAAAAHRAQFSRCAGRGPTNQKATLTGKKSSGSSSKQPEPIAESTDSTAAATDEAATNNETQRLQSTQLDVPDSVSIPSDDGWHKVTVTSIDLKPVFEHECVPQRSPYAYLKAAVTNSSPYALLPGPANIFVDGCFVGKSELKAAAPLEEFNCQLGADRGIRVAYRPVNRKRESGQSKVATVSHRQSIELQNRHNRPVKLLLMEPLPVAGEDKIKVNLVEPVVKHPEKYDRQKPVRVNRSNCVEWELELGPGEIRELVIRYNIDLPPGEALDYVVCDA